MGWFLGAGGAVGGLRCPHCGEIQERAMKAGPAVVYCRRCGKSFTRSQGEGLYRRRPKTPALPTAATSPHPLAKRPSTIPPPPAAGAARVLAIKR